MAMYIQVFIDGAARNQGDERPNEAASACVIYNKKKEIVRWVRGLGPVSNNVAEYSALIDALLICSMTDFPRPIIYTDSQVVYKHAKGIWRCRKPDLLPFYMTMKEIQDEYAFDIVWVPREKVFAPDRLCNTFLDKLELERENMKLTLKNVEDS
jgi:ribonuclease HI